MQNELKKLRRNIQKVDVSIVKAVSSRLAIARQIGKLKIKLKLPITDAPREIQQIKFFTKLAKAHKVPSALLLKIFEQLITESKRVQKGIKRI